MKLKETHSFSQVEEAPGISMSTLKREAKNRKAEQLSHKYKKTFKRKSMNIYILNVHAFSLLLE